MVDLDIRKGDAAGMIQLKELLGASKKILHDNSPLILTGIGVSGTVSTAYLSAKAGMAAARRLSNAPTNLSKREKFEETWELYIPPVLSGGITIGAIVLAARVSSKRAAAAYSLLAMSERAFEEYREKVIEVIGGKKEQDVRDRVAQDRVSANPPSLIIDEGSGILCCELFTGRYFKSDMETLRKAQNDINAKIIMNLYVSIDEFYDLVGLDYTSDSSNIGWDSGKLLDLRFSATFGPQSKPCLAFEYNYVKPI